MINLLLIGNGKWGKNYISTLSNFPNVKLTIANRDNWKQLIDAGTDGVIISTPPQSHIEIAHYSLQKNIPTMIEKPLSLSLEEASTLKQYTAPIIVNHIHLFSERYQYIKQNIVANDIEYIATEGQGNTEPRDYSELWDYGCHDISMILDLAQQMPKTVECSKFDFNERLFNITLQFSNCCKHFKAGAQVGFSTDDKKRWLVTSDRKSIYTYDKYGDRELVKLLKLENLIPKETPLTNAINIFINAISGKTDYRLGVDLALNVTKVLELCDQSIASGQIINNLA